MSAEFPCFRRPTARRLDPSMTEHGDVKNNKTNHRRAHWAVCALALTACGGGGGSGAPSIGGLTDSGYLAQIASNGEVALVTGQGATGFSELREIARDPATGVVYGVGDASDVSVTVLVRIDPTPGAFGLANPPQVIAEVTDGGVTSLVWHPNEATLYGVRPTGDFAPWRLVRIDPRTGESTDVGACARVSTLIYDPAGDTFYGVGEGSLHRIQPATGASMMLFSDATYLSRVEALSFDPWTSTFTGIFHDAFTDPGVVEFDLFGNVDFVADVDARAADVEADSTTGTMLALTEGGSLASIEKMGSTYSVTHRGNVGFELFSFSFDPADGGYFGVDSTDHLVKFQANGACRTIAELAVPTRQVVYDSIERKLWGIGSEFLMTSSDSYVYSIDPVTGETGTPVLTNLSVGTRLTFDSTAGVIRAISGVNDVTLLLDPETGDTFLTANAANLGEVRGLAWDPEAQRLVAAWSNGTPDQTSWSVWSPTVSGVASFQSLAYGNFGPMDRHATPGTFLSLGENNDLYEITVASGGTQRTRGAVRDEIYRATTRVADTGRIFATTADQVWSIDPQTGSTESVGSTPFGETPNGITWDPERSRLGFLTNDTIRWTSLSAPWQSPSQTPLDGRNVRAITYSEERGVFYLLGTDGLFTLALNSGSAIFVTVSTTAPPAFVTDITWRNAKLWASTTDGHLHEVDPDTGDWTDLGRLTFGMQGLY